jgi:hypothetical protein
MDTEQIKGLAGAMKELTQLGEVTPGNRDLWFKTITPEIVLQMLARIEMLEQQNQDKAA